MKTIFIAIGAMVVISAGAYVTLDMLGWDAASQNIGGATRLD